MVTFDKEEQKKAHKELHKKIYDCDCKPWSNGVDYCEKCQYAVIKFMNQYGAGVLTRDEEVDDLQEAFNTAMIEVGNLKQKLEGKITKYEKLKKNINQLFKELTGEFTEGSNILFRIKMCFRKVDLFKTCCINKANNGGETNG